MKITALMLPAAAVGTALFFIAPGQTRAFSTIGGSLGLPQRDFRMFNNFTNNAANNNTTEHPSFPGYDRCAPRQGRSPSHLYCCSTSHPSKVRSVAPTSLPTPR